MPSRRSLDDSTDEVSSDSATGDAQQADEGQNETVYADVEDGEYVAQVAERLYVPVTYLLDLNPEDVDRETGVVRSNRLRVG